MPLSRRRLTLLPLAFAAAGPADAAAPLTIVAAENVYGDIAAQLTGPRARITCILSNPNQDPHLFTTSPSVARALAGSNIVILNGADYDPWMPPLLAASPNPARVTLNVADLLGRKPGQNPHLWYDPAAIPALTTALVDALCRVEPAHGAIWRDNGAKLISSLAPIHARIAGLRQRFAGTPVTATEPVYGLMAAALGLAMQDQEFQRAIMNGTEPAPSDIAAIEANLRQRRVRALFYNSQVTDDLTAALLALAQGAKIPVIGVTETEPAHITYQRWIMDGLNAVDRALSPA